MTTKEHFEKNVIPYFNLKEYWDKGFKGKGIIVASVEDAYTSDDHGNNVKDTVLTYAPECKVISFNDEYPETSATADNGETQRFPEFVDWCIKNKVDIVTSSLDWSCNNKSEQDAIIKLYENGIIFCNCAGNSGSEIKRNEEKKKPKDFDKELVTVSGIMIDTSSKVKWSGFNYGEAVDVLGIGSNCPTIDEETGKMYSWSGTSAATPMVAGVLATYKSYDNTLNSKNVFEKIINKSEKHLDYKGSTYNIIYLPSMQDLRTNEEDNIMEKIKSPYKSNYTITQHYSKAHTGVDLVGLIDKYIYAVKAGKIDYLGWENNSNHSQGFGYYIRVLGEDGLYYYYGHLNWIHENLKVGDKVEEGQLLGLEGSTGKSTGSHLHLEIRKKIGTITDMSNSVNVEELLPNEDDIKEESEVRKALLKMNTKLKEKGLQEFNVDYWEGQASDVKYLDEFIIRYSKVFE